MQRRGCLEFLRLENESCDSMRLGDAFLRGNKSETSPADNGQVFFGGIDGPKEQWISCKCCRAECRELIAKLGLVSRGWKWRFEMEKGGGS